METSVVRRTIPTKQPPLPQRLAAGAYLTDESNLFRCISVDRSLHPDATILLEDCLSLEVLILPMTEVAGARLRVVRPGHRDQIDSGHPAELALEV